MLPIYDNYLFFYPFIPSNCNKPPTLYSVLNSIVNGDKEEYEEYIKIKDLAKEGRKVIFNFEYPLTENIDKEKFETMILNHYLQRRIGFETVAAFRIQLDIKLNEIMPLYNKMFDGMSNWDIFNSGEVTTRIGKDDRISQNTNNTTNNLTNKSNTETENILDRKNSELPQNRLEDLRNGSYVTNYSYDTNTNKGEDILESKGITQAINEGTDKNEYNETITRSPGDKISILKEMQENIKSIYTLIFKDLDCLFYGLV